MDSEEGNYKETLPPWAGAAWCLLLNLTAGLPTVVNMAVSVCETGQRGFGVLKSAPGPELPFEGPFRYYHGQFHAARSTGGASSTLILRYFQDCIGKARWGKGGMDYQEGTPMTGFRCRN